MPFSFRLFSVLALFVFSFQAHAEDNIVDVPTTFSSVMSADGVRSVASAFPAKESADRLENLLKEKGMRIFARINHAENAKGAGMELRDTELLLFGNPKIGTPLMQCAQSIAIDLPQKALIWTDMNGQTWMTYNDPMYLKVRHSVRGCDGVLEKVSKALANLTKAAATK